MAEVSGQFANQIIDELKILINIFNPETLSI